jgi:hypothetical protein
MKRMKIVSNKLLNDLRWHSGICKICGETFDIVTHYHAGLHGYANAVDYIMDEKVHFDNEVLNDKIKTYKEKNK